MVPVSYPNKTPPNATNIPMTICRIVSGSHTKGDAEIARTAGHDRPGTPSGFFREMPIMSSVLE